MMHFLDALPLYFDVPEGVLPPGGGNDLPIDTPASRPPRIKRCECEFCECTLTAEGEVLKLSDKARTLRDQKEKLDKLDRELADTARQLTEARAELAALKPGKKRGLELFG